jgi:hypothetical protein
MKTIFTVLFVAMTCFACKDKEKDQTPQTPDVWADFAYPEVDFHNLAGETNAGWIIYNRLVPNPEELIANHALYVAKELYWEASDSTIPKITNLTYNFEDYDGVSEKAGAPPHIWIKYSSRWVESSAANNGDSAVLYETRGVLYHELVHGYQAEPKGCGNYGDGNSKEFWIFIEGMADAVRAHCGFFSIETDRQPGGSWRDGYRTTGYFLEWLTTKDPDFLRKFNRTAHEFDVWSFDSALKSIFGENITTSILWNQYQDYLRGLQYE